MSSSKFSPSQGSFIPKLSKNPLQVWLKIMLGSPTTLSVFTYFYIYMLYMYVYPQGLAPTRKKMILIHTRINYFILAGASPCGLSMYCNQKCYALPIIYPDNLRTSSSNVLLIYKNSEANGTMACHRMSAFWCKDFVTGLLTCGVKLLYYK